MRITVLSDTHNCHKNINLEPCDILIHCGDATTYGTWEEAYDFFKWFDIQLAYYKIFVPGNHDRFMEGFGDFMVGSILILTNNIITVNGLKICASSFFSRPKRILTEERSEHDSFRVLFTKTKERIKMENCDIRITHSPPYGILDKVNNSRRGCEIIQEITQEYKASIHLFGHIHSGYGQFTTDTTTFYNAAMCDDNNQLVNPPTVIEWYL